VRAEARQSSGEEFHDTLRDGSMLAFLCGTQGIATLVINLNRIHKTNAQWTKHVLFHLV
jgi:hypothetical protein